MGIPDRLRNSALIRRALFVFFLCAWISIICIDLAAFLNFTADSRIIVHNPVPGDTYPAKFKVAGFAWDKNSIDRGEDLLIEVFVTRVADGKSFRFEGARSASRIKANASLRLSSFNCQVGIPEEDAWGTWSVSARMTTYDNRVYETAQRKVYVDREARGKEFVFLSPEHIVTLVLVLILSVWVVLFFGKDRNIELRPFVGLAFLLILWINEIVYHAYWSATGAWSPSGTLMFHMCGFSLLIMPIAFLTKKARVRKYVAEAAYFWGLGGAVQALLTPDIGVHGFPEFRFFQFMIVHGIIVVNALFLVSAYNIKIGPKSFLRAVLLTNLCAGVSFILNPLFKLVPPFETANYFVVSYPPPEGSIIDLFVLWFGPSPNYFIGLELMGLAVFAVLCFPFVSFKGVISAFARLFFRKAREGGIE